MANEERRCPRNCTQCSMVQQAYCAAQMSLSTMDLVQSLSERFDALMVKISGNSEQPIVSPLAQERAAAQIIDSPNKLKSKENDL